MFSRLSISVGVLRNLAASSSVSEDIIRAKKANISDKNRMIIARISVVVIAIIAMFIAKNPDSKVFEIVSFAWAGFGATFGPLMILSLFWKRTNRAGAVAGMISGGLMVFFWKLVIRPIGVNLGGTIGGVLNIYELLPAFIVSIIFIVVVSLITKKPSAEIEKEFDGQGYGTFKTAVAQSVIDTLKPVQDEYNRILADKAYLESVAKEGAARASYLARKTLSKVYRKVGFVEFK